MTPRERGFLPESLRRPKPAPRRRARRRWPTLVVVPAMFAALPLWQIEHVSVVACPAVPAAVVESLQNLIGEPALLVDLDRIRRSLEIWPGVDAVEVQLELPGTLDIRVQPSAIVASVQLGARWHGVAPDGELTGPLRDPVSPRLERVTGSLAGRRGALAVVRRVSEASRRQVLSIRQVTPSDLELELEAVAPEDRGPVVHVAPQPTAAERWFCERLAAGEVPGHWADLRWDTRLVVGGGP